MPERLFRILVPVLILMVAALNAAPAAARVPPDHGNSGVAVDVLRNFDAFDAHWAAHAGYVWRGRLDARLEWRQDGILGPDLIILQAEAALVRTRGFILESGYHHTLSSKYHRNFDVIPVRVSLPFSPMDRLWVMPNVTYWRVMADDSDALGFAALDFQWEERYTLGFELNVNQDFRYHYLDVRLGYRW